MENSKQTAIPMAKQFPLRWIFGTMALFLIGGLIFINTGNAEDKYIAKYPIVNSQVDKLIRNSWCPLKKQAALAKLEDDNHGLKYPDMNRDQTALYRDMDCSKLKVDIMVEFEPQPAPVSFIPEAKALSFDQPGLEQSNAEEKPVTSIVKPTLDLDKLAIAVSFAETGGCKDGTAIKRNNCFGIMQWNNGKRSPRYFNSQKESFDEFKRIWNKSYKVFPTFALAQKWTGNDNPYNWLNTVNKHYY